MINWYKTLADLTRNLSVSVKCLNPSGCSSDRNGFRPGIFLPDGNRTGMPLALLQVPHGGAQKMPTQLGDFTHCQHRAWPSGMVKSATSSRPASLLRLWSTPKEDLSPSCCRQVVTRAEPAQISRKNGSAGMCAVTFGSPCKSLEAMSSWEIF